MFTVSMASQRLQKEGKLLIFCAKTELSVIHESEYLICDGTFEMAPDSSYQLHIAWFCSGEGMPLLWALLPNKTSGTYGEMFSVLRSELMSTFGDLGSLKYIIVDYEQKCVYNDHTMYTYTISMQQHKVYLAPFSNNDEQYQYPPFAI